MSHTGLDRDAVSLLERLLDAPAWCDLRGVANQMRLDEPRLRQLVDQLRQADCAIEVHPGRGIQLRSTGLGCWADYIELHHPAGIGRRTLVYRQTGSTQEIARNLITGRAQPARLDGTIVVTDEQTAGRGRLGRQWHAPPGSALLMTAITDRAGFTVDRLMLAAAHSVAESVTACAGLQPSIRWPNDVLLDGAKLAGILVEVVEDMALIGIGINVSLDEAQIRRMAPRVDQPIASLLSAGARIDRLRLLDRLCNELHAALHVRSDGELAEAWRARSALWHRRVTVDAAGRRLTGRVIDLDPVEGLMLEVERGPIVCLPAATTRLGPPETADRSA